MLVSLQTGSEAQTRKQLSEGRSVKMDIRSIFKLNKAAFVFEPLQHIKHFALQRCKLRQKSAVNDYLLTFPCECIYSLICADIKTVS